LPKVEDLVFEMTNQARRAKGLAPLSQDAELTQVARAYSDDMLVRRFFDHTTPDGVPFDERISDRTPLGIPPGEHLSAGYHTEPQKWPTNRND
jgi:uncharacterized protein YkwD